MADQTVILFDIMTDIVNSMVVPNVQPINFQAGRQFQILTELQKLDNSINNKGDKFPLIAMYLPIPEKKGISAVYYAEVTIPRIIIAQIVSWDGTEPVSERFKDTGSFKTILYPCYYELLRRIAWNLNVIGSDPNMFEHTKIDNPGTVPLNAGANDYIDALEIHNLKLTLSQFKTCSK